MRRLVLILAAAVALTACYSSEIVVIVGADGSGTIQHRARVDQQALAAIHHVFSQFDEEDDEFPAEASEVLQADLTEAWAASTAPAFGRGVRHVASEVRRLATGPALTSSYEFDDVQQLEIPLDPPAPGDISAHIGGVTPLGEARLDTSIRFTLAQHEQGHRVLTARFPGQTLDPTPEPQGGALPAQGPGMHAALQQFLRGARVRIAVRPTTSLLRTSSPYRDDREVVLLDADLEKAILSGRAPALTNPASFDELRWMAADLPGIELPLEREVTIEFVDDRPDRAEPAPAQPTPPDTDIFLASLSRDGDRLTIGRPENITRHPGYDNQPFFTPDGEAIFFTSARDGRPPDPAVGAAIGSDIYRYEIATGRTSRVTTTPESEYSPTVTPDGAHISVVRVEADGTQRLWRFAIDGTRPEVLLPEIRGVGYHAWVSERSVALFVLGEPPTLQVADVKTGTTRSVARAIGRSLQRMPDGGISFVRREELPPAFTVMRLDPRTEQVRLLVRAVEGTTDGDLAWTPDGVLLMAAAGGLHAWRAEWDAWQKVADLDALGLEAASRLAVSPRGDRLAIVARPRR